MAGFKSFLLKTNALALAVGVIIGVALGNVVTSLVNDIIMPPIGMALGNVDFSSLKIVLKSAEGTSPEVAINWGKFINTIISFVIVAFVVYAVSSVFLRPAPESPAPELKTCPFCKELVASDATKCRACTSAI